MPSSDAILNWASGVANDWRALAVVWHAALGLVLVSLMRGWRPANRTFGLIVVMPIVSVAALAWISGNPFNGAVFSGLAVLFAWLATELPRGEVRIAALPYAAAGAAVIVYGSVYPHFLTAASWTTYLYASPFGLVPCPTLAVTIGLALLTGSFNSTKWLVSLVMAGLTYGAIGVFRLGVQLDWGLLLASALLASSLPRRETAGVRLPVQS